MTDIKFDKKNYRKHNDKNKKLIKKSLQDCGAGRSILIDSENEIIAGNGVYEQIKNLKIPVKIVETDGNELIAVKRTDLKTDDAKRKQLAIMDNSTFCKGSGKEAASKLGDVEIKEITDEDLKTV